MLIKSLNLVLSLALVSMISCNLNSTKQHDFIKYGYQEEQIKIEKLIHDILDSSKNKKFDKLESFHLYGPKFTKFDDWEPLDKQDADMTRKSEREAFEALDNFSYELKDMKVDVFDKVAIATFIANYELQMGEDNALAKARGTMVFVKDGDNWKITHEHFSAFKANP